MSSMANPYAGTSSEGGWAMGFSWGFVGPAFSSLPPSVIAPDQVEVFNEGVLAGQQAAISGLPIEPDCVSLEQEVSSGAEAFMGGVHVLEGFGLLRAAPHLAHFAAEGFVAVFLLMIPGPPPLDAANEFAVAAQNVRQRLDELGLSRNSLFLSAGIDEQVRGCEVRFTRVFRTQGQAREAVEALGRPHWIVAQWDADAPMSGGGFEVIESA